jgi:hypothetical protein
MEGSVRVITIDHEVWAVLVEGEIIEIDEDEDW